MQLGILLPRTAGLHASREEKAKAKQPVDAARVHASNRRSSRVSIDFPTFQSLTAWVAGNATKRFRVTNPFFEAVVSISWKNKNALSNA